MKQLLEKHGKTHFNGCLPAYDGRKGFYTAGALPFTSKDFNIKLIDRDESGDINCTVVGRSFFAPGFHKSEIGFGVECWKGFYQSLRPTQMGMSLNMGVKVEVAHGESKRYRVSGITSQPTKKLK
ncbi:hypothetical protein CISIN_1g046499mg [Citrus sinensis]|uniref:Argonaute linker 1 domain-containing protein n=1 Tax=Citrus sinensis TaxID=2711 RepID=A0A067FWB5_CITSI|nr:hypothetical protein CISIN_1g046499mg [Citrus sinensis]